MALSLLICALGSVFLKTLDTVYRTALYVFATEGVVPEPFDDGELHGIWEVSQPQD
jgi:hypothetical protein